MTWAAAWPRRLAASALAGLLPLFGALAIVAGGGAGGVAGTIFAESHDVDAVAPNRVTPVRQALPAQPQVDRVDPPPAIVDAGPPRRAELRPVAMPEPPADGVAAGPAAVPDQRGPPRLSTP